MTITIEQLVQREVNYNVSQLISELLYSYDSAKYQDQLFELMRGPEDYEGAAIDEGWAGDYLDDGSLVTWNTDLDIEPDERGDWQELCEDYHIEPYYTDALEHWLVSDWLADKLIAKGETVDKDFMGLTIWARTTSGQSIAYDYVIQQIYQELVKG